MGELFEDAGEAVAGVVDDDVDAVEPFEGRFEGSVDVGLLGNIEL